MLLEHNHSVYQALEDMLEEENRAILVTATGTGKSYLALEYLERHDLRALVVCPKRVICDAWKNLSGRVDVMTYQAFCRMSRIPAYGCYIFDEAHHAGSPVWGGAVRRFMDSCKMPVIGLTADSKRYSDGGRDVADELWGGCIVHGYDQAEAVDAGILPSATYVSAMFGVEEHIQKLKQKPLEKSLAARLDYTLKNCGAMEDILLRHMPAGNRKGIVFVSSIRETDEAQKFVLGVYPQLEVQILHSLMPDKKQNELISNFENQDSGFLVAVDMLNEGLHVRGVNTVIMLRRTGSFTVFSQQLGRCLAPGNQDVAVFDFVGNRCSLQYITKRTGSAVQMFQNQRTQRKSNQIIVYDYASPIVSVLNEVRQGLNPAWTADEDAILRKHYASDGAKECQRRVHGRTIPAIRERARKLGLWERRHAKAVPWTEDEHERLKALFPIEGVACHKKFPGRSKESVLGHAYAHGLQNIHMWTKEEDDIIRKYYPIEGYGCMPRLPRRTKAAIGVRAHKLGVPPPRRQHNRAWTEEEDQIIRGYYLQEGQEIAARLPHRTIGAIMARANDLGVKRRPRKSTLQREKA